MASIFSRIINGEISCHKIAENEHFFAFLDINPRAQGHTLVVPKKEVDEWTDLDDETYAGLMAFAQKIAKALRSTIPCKRVAVSIIGLEVPHCHIHLIPINAISDTNFQKPAFVTTQDELAETAAIIRGAL